MKLHIFNPENDMALASGSPGYTPPANIRAYRRLHWQLPRQWAAPEDIVWDGDSSLSHLFAGAAAVTEICPWGWSPALVHELELAGVPRHCMPDKEWLDKLRLLSSRESTVRIQSILGLDSKYCLSLDDVLSCLLQWGDIIMKSPWSSSGKGLMRTDNPNWQGWVKRILRQQGAVVVERFLDRKQDFALEFWMREGKAEYVGLNVFVTDAHGHFLGNVEATELEKEKQLLLMLANPQALAEIREWYIDNLPVMAPWYEGPVGVDMLVTSDGKLYPCVEINWRMTMGMACVLASKR
ncbi:MAG: hypothetical protein J6R11_07065 [Bacteroidaceae bacterium]|nr:hypothetical protein [Bacteroidaceae bacterium]